MTDWFKKIHWAGVVGLATTILGIVSDPAVAGLLPHNVAVVVAVVGAVIQASTRAVTKGDVVEVPKPPAI